MDEKCKQIFSVIKKSGKIRFKDLEKELVDDKKIMSKPTLSQHLYKHLFNRWIEKVPDETTSSIQYYIIKENQKTKSERKSTVKIIKPKRKLNIELFGHGITNRGHDVNDPINSEVEILLLISNSTEKRIGVRKIVTEFEDKDYQIPISMQEVEENRYKHISSFIIDPEQTRLIRLFREGNKVAPKGKYRINSNVKIYGTKNEIIQKIPVKLSISYRSL